MWPVPDAPVLVRASGIWQRAVPGSHCAPGALDCSSSVWACSSLAQGSWLRVGTPPASPGKILLGAAPGTLPSCPAPPEGRVVAAWLHSSPRRASLAGDSLESVQSPPRSCLQVPRAHSGRSLCPAPLGLAPDPIGPTLFSFLYCFPPPCPAFAPALPDLWHLSFLAKINLTAQACNHSTLGD